MEGDGPNVNCLLCEMAEHATMRTHTHTHTVRICVLSQSCSFHQCTIVMLDLCCVHTCMAVRLCKINKQAEWLNRLTPTFPHDPGVYCARGSNHSLRVSPMFFTSSAYNIHA